MTQWHLKSKRKTTGAIRPSRRRCNKKLAWIGGNPSATTVDSEIKRHSENKRGKTTKVKLKAEQFVMVSDPKKPTEKIRKLEIVTVDENNADRQFARRNIITKSSILKVKDGSKELYVKVTSRPGQQGSINAILLEGYEKEKEEKLKDKKKDKKAKKIEKKTKTKPKSKKDAKKDEKSKKE